MLDSIRRDFYVQVTIDMEENPVDLLGSDAGESSSDAGSSDSEAMR